MTSSINDDHHNDTQHNDIQQNDTQHNDIHTTTLIIMTLSIMTFSIMTLSIMTLYAHAKCLLCWVSQISPLNWMSLCSMSRHLIYYQGYWIPCTDLHCFFRCERYCVTDQDCLTGDKCLAVRDKVTAPKLLKVIITTGRKNKLERFSLDTTTTLILPILIIRI